MHSLKYLLSRTFQTHLKPIKSSRIVCQHLSDDCSKAETDRSKSFDSKKIDRNDMEDLFLDQRVRYLLKSLTGYDPGKVFSQKSMDNLNSPKFSFMTDQQLQMVKLVYFKDLLMNLLFQRKSIKLMSVLIPCCRCRL